MVEIPQGNLANQLAALNQRRQGLSATVSQGFRALGERAVPQRVFRGIGQEQPQRGFSMLGRANENGSIPQRSGGNASAGDRSPGNNLQAESSGQRLPTSGEAVKGDQIAQLDRQVGINGSAGDGEATGIYDNGDTKNQTGAVTFAAADSTGDRSSQGDGHRSIPQPVDGQTPRPPAEQVSTPGSSQLPAAVGHDSPISRAAESEKGADHEVDLFSRTEHADRHQSPSAHEPSGAIDQPEPILPYLKETDRRRKITEYSEVIAQGGYPLLYATCIDLLTLDEAELTQGLRMFFPAVNLSDSTNEKQDSKMLRADVLRVRLTESKIKFTNPSEVRHVDAEYRDPYGKSIASFTALNEQDMELFGDAMSVLKGKLAQIPNSEDEAITMQVEGVLEDSVPHINEANTTNRALHGVYEGFFSVLRTGMYLSQKRVDRLDKLTTKHRLLAVLKSDAISEFTKIAQLATLANLPYVDAIPNHLLQRSGDSFAVHPDTIAFIKLMNELGAQNIPQHVLCPFSYPLGEIRAQAAITDTYQGRLPAEVEQMVVQNMNIPGIKTAGVVLADFLADRI